MISILDRWTAWLCEDRWAVGAALARIGFGSIVLLTLVICYPQRSELFFRSGIEPLGSFVRAVEPSWGPNIFALPIREPYETLIYLAAVIVALSFTIGIWTRPMTILFAVVTWSLVHRCPGFIDGGYRLLGILSIYLCFANVGRVLSLDRRFYGNRVASETVRMLHNAAIVTCIIQLCIVYVFSAFYKVQGPSWQQGTALYYVLQDPEFQVSWISSIIGMNPYLVATGTYATLIFQSAFPWLLINPRMRFVAVGTALLFHLGIAFAMGLYWFSSIMITCELVVLQDSDYDAVMLWIRKLHRRAQRMLQETLAFG